MDANLKKDIQEFEEAGLEVVLTEDNKLTHATGGINQSDGVCDSCSFLKFESDPAPDDWFHDMDQRVVCLKMHRTIYHVDHPREATDISKPFWCPFLGRELTEEEKKLKAIFFKNEQDHV